MKLWRSFYSKLDNWLVSNDRNPLLIIGARQTGKTFSVLEFAQEKFNDKFIYLNFMKDEKIKEKLKDITNPSEIINILCIYFDKKIDSEYLIIFDEIQELSNIRTSFKFFKENMPEYKVIGLGSYLLNALFNDGEGFPVGKVDTIQCFPLTFYEYLFNANKFLFEKIKQRKFEKSVLDEVLEIWKDYCIVGGLPKIVSTYLHTKNLKDINDIKHQYYNDYINDITKQIINKVDKVKAIMIFENIIKFLSKENNSYSLSVIEKHARYRDYENALLYLLRTHIVNEIKCIDKLKYPLLINVINSKFKLFYFDHGFMSYILNTTQNSLFSDEKLSNYKGAVAETIIFNDLKTKLLRNNQIYYHKFISNGISYEIDIVLNGMNNKIVPIEIKSGNNLKAKSLFNLLKTNNEIENAMFLSLNSEIKVEKINNTKILYFPIYLFPFIEIVDDRIDAEKLIEIYALSN